MPAAALHLCPTCKALVSGRCTACRQQAGKSADLRRGSASERGYGTRWAKTSAGLRRSQLRWCGDTVPGVKPTGDSSCPSTGIHRTLSAVVDHIVPVTDARDQNFWKRENWQGLCETCHNRKRQREQQLGQARFARPA